MISNFIQACSSVDELGCITDKAHGPMVAFAPLGMTARMQEATSTWHPHLFTQQAFAIRGAQGGLFTIEGFHKDPSRGPRDELSEKLYRRLPGSPQRTALAELLTDRFTRLASQWNTRVLHLEMRGNAYARERLPPGQKQRAHIDHTSKYVAIAYLANQSALFAHPQTYVGVSPLRYVHEQTQIHRVEYPMTAEMQAGLQQLPAGSLGTWRGGDYQRDRPAVHLIPEFTGARPIVLAEASHNSLPALG